MIFINNRIKAALLIVSTIFVNYANARIDGYAIYNERTHEGVIVKIKLVGQKITISENLAARVERHRYIEPRTIESVKISSGGFLGSSAMIRPEPEKAQSPDNYYMIIGIVDNGSGFHVRVDYFTYAERDAWYTLLALEVPNQEVEKQKWSEDRIGRTKEMAARLQATQERKQAEREELARRQAELEREARQRAQATRERQIQHAVDRMTASMPTIQGELATNRAKVSQAIRLLEQLKSLADAVSQRVISQNAAQANAVALLQEYNQEIFSRGMEPKRAYLKAAVLFHPDKNPEAPLVYTELFKELGTLFPPQ